MKKKKKGQSINKRNALSERDERRFRAYLEEGDGLCFILIYL